jgi:hypothetical protein
MTDNPDSERRPRPEDETRIIHERSAGHAALTAVETIATGGGLTLGGLAAADLYGKAKDAISSKGDGSKSSNDSKD